jgi:DNA-binding response OmpR family regulator
MNSKTVILSVMRDHNERTKLSGALRAEGFDTLEAANLAELDQAMQTARISLAVIDVTGFDARIWSRCTRLGESAVPYFVLTAHRSPSLFRYSRRHGATACFSKPLSFEHLVEFVRDQLPDPVKS